MDDDKIKQVISRLAKSDADLAETQAPAAIAEAVLAIVAAGEVLTLDALLAALAQPVANPFLRHRNATAQALILAACPRPSLPPPPESASRLP
jgi:hypothetical protein